MTAMSRRLDLDAVSARLGMQPAKRGPLRVVPEPEPPAPVAKKATRPESAVNMIGQVNVRRRLMSRLVSAKVQGELPGHILFHGPPGLGKTSLAAIVAAETGGELHTTNVEGFKDARTLGKTFGKLSEGDTLFIDEVHELTRSMTELLNTAMEDGEITIPAGDGKDRATVTVKLPPFVLVAATTETGELPAPFLSRFSFVGSMDYYSDDELAQILIEAAERQGRRLTEDAAVELGWRSRGTPRTALHLLDAAFDYRVSMDRTTDVTIDETTVLETLEMEDIDAMGLNVDDRAVLTAVCVDFEGGPVGLPSLAPTVGIKSKTITNVIETYLIRVKLLKLTSRGRVATRRAFEHLGLPVPITAAWLK